MAIQQLHEETSVMAEKRTFYGVMESFVFWK